MIIFLLLFIEFFKTGLFSIGGGLATIPFLYEFIEKYHWYTKDMLMNMIAISESTPGAIGVNMATYVGYEVTHSILGGILTTIGLVAPSIIIICILARFLQSFKNHPWIQSAFYGLRPTVCALIASAGLGMFCTTMFSNTQQKLLIFPILLFIAGVIFTKKFEKLHPIFIICIFGLIGILFQL